MDFSNKTAEELLILRNNASQAYYGDRRSELSDREFDELDNLIKTMNIVEESVGHGYQPTGKKIKHEHKMLSLDKSYEESEISAWVKKYPLYPNYIVQPKYDGLACIITFNKDGSFKNAATRGKGNVGEDISHTIRAMMSAGLLPDKLDDLEGNEGNIYIIGELYINAESLDGLNEKVVAEEQSRIDERVSKIQRSITDNESKTQTETRISQIEKLKERLIKESIPKEVAYDSPRNGAAGIVRRKTTNLAHFMSFVAYDTNHYSNDEIDTLELYGFLTPKEHYYKVARSVKDIMTYIKEIQEKSISDFDFDIDGVVIKLKASREKREKIGNSTTYPRWAIAFKFKNEVKETEILDVIWNPTRTDRIVPVAILKPVYFNSGKAKIARATLYNYQNFKELDMAIGDTIAIEYAGAVIPKIIEVVSHNGGEKMKAPTFHPTEEYPVSFSPTGIDMVKHPDAPASPALSIEYALKMLEVKGIGPSLIDSLLTAGKIENFLDMLSLETSTILEIDGFSNKKQIAENTVKALKDSHAQPLWRWLAAMGIPLIASTKSPILESHWGSLDEIAEVKMEDLLALDEFGEEKSKSLIKHQPMIKEWARRLRTEKGIEPKPEAKKAIKKAKGDIDYTGKKVVITGVFPNMGRKDVQTWIKEHGGVIASSVTSKVDYLIYGEKAGTNLAKANKLIESGSEIILIKAENFENNV